MSGRYNARPLCGEATPIPSSENASYKETNGGDYQHHREGDTVPAHPGARDRESQEEDRGAYQGTLCVELGCIDARTEKDEDKDENQGNDEALLHWGRALDRVLTWNHYVIPQWHLSKFRVASWDKFSRPAVRPKYTLGIDTWWIDPAKERKLPRR